MTRETLTPVRSAVMTAPPFEAEKQKWVGYNAAILWQQKRNGSENTYSMD